MDMRKVQAIDALGVWANGKELQDRDNGILVRFDGFGSEHDRLCLHNEVRDRLLPYQEYLRRK